MSLHLSAIPTRTARWCALHPWRAMLAWVAFVTVAVALAALVPTQETTDADYRLGESGRADELVTSAGLDAPTTENVLVTTSSGDLDHATAESAAAALTKAMRGIDGVEKVSAPQWSPDGTAMLVAVQLAKNHEDAAPLVVATASVQEEFPDLDIREAGDLTVDDAVNDQVAQDLSSAETISLPLTLILMLIAFGALIAAGLPVLLAATSVAATVGIIAPLSYLVHADATVTSMIVLIGMAVGVDDAVNDQVAQDLSSAETISLPLTLILMLIAFGALFAAGLPVLLAATSVAATVGIIAPLSYLVHADATVTSMIVLIGMAVGVDYSLFYLKREREERAKGHSTLDAVAIAAQTSGHSILVSGGAVIASMAGLFIIGDTTFNSLAVGAIIVVAVAVLGSITVLPALLAKLGRWVDRPRVPLLWRLNNRIGRGGISRRVLAPVVGHPALALTFSSLIVVALAIPALGMKTHSGNLETLPASIPEAQTLRAMSAAFPSEGAVADLVVHAPADRQAAVAGALRQVTGSAEDTGLFVGGAVPVQVSEDGRTSVLQLAMPFEESDSRVDDAIRQLRSELAPAALDGMGAEYAVGGDAAESLDFVDRENQRLPLVIGFVLLLTLLIMAFTFRSLAIAVVSTVLNLASVGVAFGLMTLVFQHGWFEGPLDFTSPGFVIDWLPLFVLVVLVGLSMDYHVFVLSRVREHLQRGLPARLAVREGIADTAGVVTSAATVMVSVFAIFATLSMMEMKMMGVGLSAAILVDATVIRLVMLPAILVLLGERAWWPTRPQRPVGDPVEETEPAYELAAR